jgi:hypothetical protein
MTPLNEAKAIATDMSFWIIDVETAKGPQPRLRHLAHMLQAEAEKLLGVDAGTILPVPAGGIPKPGLDDGTSPDVAS